MTMLFAASGNPNAVTTALIAAGSAVVGGLLTVVAQLLVEGKRAEHERQVETRRVEHEENQQRDEDAALLRGAARLLHQELSYIVALFRVAQATGTVWATGVERTSQLTADERRVLARQLAADEWDTVTNAQNRADTMMVARRMMENEEFFRLTDEHSGMKATLPFALQVLEQALVVLRSAAEGAAEVTGVGDPP
jgi:hypothetical protein